MKIHTPCLVCGAPTVGGLYLNEALLDQTQELERLRVEIVLVSEELRNLKATSVSIDKDAKPYD